MPAQRQRPASVRDHAGRRRAVPPQPGTRPEAAHVDAQPAVLPRASVRSRRSARTPGATVARAIPAGGSCGVGDRGAGWPAVRAFQLGCGPLVRRRAHAHAALSVAAVVVLSGGQDPARARPRSRGKGLGRRSAGDGLEPAVAGAGAVRRCLGSVRFPGKAPPRRRWRSGHHGRAVPRRARGFCLASCPGRYGARHRVRHDADRRDVHRAVQRQSAAALRWLLRAFRPARRPQPRLPRQRLRRIRRAAPLAWASRPRPRRSPEWARAQCCSAMRCWLTHIVGSSPG